MSNGKKKKGDADVMGEAVSEAGEAVRRREENLQDAAYNRAMLEERSKAGKDRSDTPEFGRLASRPKSRTRKGKLKPARLKPVEAGREYDPDAAWKFGRDKAAIAANRPSMRKRKVKTQKFLDLRAKGGSVGGPKRKAYANGGSVRAARF
jgi:hypothetical protein